MTKRIFKIINYTSYIFGVSILVGIFYTIYYINGFENSERLLIHKALLIYFIFALLMVVSFFIWVVKTKQGKKYKKMYIDWQNKKIESQAIEEIKGTGYYRNLPEYTGKNAFVPKGLFLEKIGIVIFSFFSIVPIVALIYLFIRNSDSAALLGAFFISLIIPSVCLLSYLWSLKRQVTIDENGVKLCRKTNGKYKTLSFTWEDIKVVALSVSPEGRRISWGYLYFTTKEIKRDRVIIEYFEKSYVIMIKYRPKVVHCVLKYWDKEIRNLEAMKNWKRYIDKLK